jgi:hypothetical protein
MKQIMRDELGAPKVVDRSTFQAELDALRVREKAHTREGDAIAAARRRLAGGAAQPIRWRGFPTGTTEAARRHEHRCDARTSGAAGAAEG